VTTELRKLVLAALPSSRSQQRSTLRTRCAFTDNTPAIEDLKQGNRLCNNMYSIEKVQLYHWNKRIVVWWENETLVLCRELPPLTPVPAPVVSSPQPTAAPQ
jgi:hypothetical protein